eukprot:m.190533 g.190533  ORF g.190533 m.190533 type:complete len:100 (-) comp10582_c0_seq5:436-735(-)
MWETALLSASPLSCLADACASLQTTSDSKVQQSLEQDRGCCLRSKSANGLHSLAVDLALTILFKSPGKLVSDEPTILIVERLSPICSPAICNQLSKFAI